LRKTDSAKRIKTGNYSIKRVGGGYAREAFEDKI